MPKNLIINFPDEETRKDFVRYLEVTFLKDESREPDEHPAHQVNQDLITYLLPDKSEEGELDGGELFNLLMNGCRTNPWENSPNKYVAVSESNL